MNENLLAIRNKMGYSQDEVAKKLGVSRQTYSRMEKDGDITSSQLEVLSDFFGLPLSEFYYNVQNTDKFKQMYIYILSKFGKGGVPKTKLAKLLYLADFNHYYNFFESMSGVQYKCKEYGPLADPYLELTDDLFDQGEISISVLSLGAQMISLNDPDSRLELGLLSSSEREEIDDIVEEWRDKNTQSIVNFTHHQKPWMACRPNEVIPYELILQEDPDHVY